MSSFDKYFPNLQQHRITSPPTPRYNCIAWAVGDQDNWWWADAGGGGYWPTGVPREETLDSFMRAFETQGFVPCEHADPEQGVAKIAFYAIGQQPTHAARQLEHGLWSSKLGTLEDIEHTLEALEGEWYGAVVMIFARPTELT